MGTSFLFMLTEVERFVFSVFPSAGSVGRLKSALFRLVDQEELMKMMSVCPDRGGILYLQEICTALSRA